MSDHKAQERVDPRRYHEAVAAARSPHAQAPPVCLYLETTNRCNLLCTTCPRTYAELERDLQQHRGADELFTHRVLNRILEQARDIARRGGEDSYQALVEHHFQRELGGLLLAERFVRSAVGLVIILGLAGTFYGLSLSIGKLVRLVSGGPSDLTDITQALTQGLTQALSGMSVAFTASLFGISTAVPPLESVGR